MIIPIKSSKVDIAFIMTVVSKINLNDYLRINLEILPLTCKI